MAKERLRICHWDEPPQGMQLGWPVHRGEGMSADESDIVPANNGWCLGDDFGRSWRPAGSIRDELEGNWRHQRRTRPWNAREPLSRSGRAKIRGRGRGDSVSHIWGASDAPGPSELVYETNHGASSSRGEVKQENEEPSVVGMDEESHRPKEESNAEVLAAAEHAELETHAKHVLRLAEQLRRTSECKEQEHRNLYKRARLEAESEHQQRLDLQQQVFSVNEDNEKLTAEVASLRAEVASARAEVDREKKSCSTWRERLMKHEGRIGKLQGEIEQLNGVRGESEKIKNELDSVRAQLESEQSKSAQLQERLTTLESTLKSLQESHDSISHDLQEEKDKALCQICMDRPRDTCSLPCVHLNYCSQCLLQHLQTNKNCPACRTPTSGTLQTSLFKL